MMTFAKEAAGSLYPALRYTMQNTSPTVLGVRENTVQAYRASAWRVFMLGVT